MKNTEKKSGKTATATEWITIKEVMEIIRKTSHGGVMSFVRKHQIRVNSKTGQHLFPKHEIYEALDAGAVTMGI